LEKSHNAVRYYTSLSMIDAFECNKATGWIQAGSKMNLHNTLNFVLYSKTTREMSMKLS